MKKLFILLLAFATVFTLSACSNHDTNTEVTVTEEDVEAIVAQVFLSGDLSNVIGDLELPTIVGENVTITWSSDNEAVISTIGEVTRDGKDGENQVVTLTASITVEDITKTKEFRCRVIKFEVDPSYTIADIKALAKDSQVYAVGFKVLAIYQVGYYITDGAGVMNVYTGAIPTVAVGNEVTVTGNMGSYRDAQQIVDSVVEVTANTSTVGDPEISTESETIDVLDTLYADHSAYNTIKYLKGIIVVEETEYTDYYLQDKDDPSKRYEIYYKSPTASLDALKALQGKYVEGVFYLYNSGYIMTFETEATFNEIVLTVEEQINAELASVTSGFNQIVEDFTLPNIVAEQEITWTTTATTITVNVEGDYTTFTVDRPIGEGAVDENGTIVGTYSTDKTVTYDVTVKAKVASETVAEILALENDEVVLTAEFLVSAVIKNGFYVTDGTEYIFVYTGGEPEGVVAGNYIVVQGEKGEYKGTGQITGNPTYTVSETPSASISEPDVSNVIYTVDQVLAGMEDGSLIGQVVQMYGTLSLQGSYNNVFFNDPGDETVEVEVYYKSPDASVDALEAQNGNLVIATIYVYNNESVVFVGATEDIATVAESSTITEIDAAIDSTPVVLDGVKVAAVIKNGFYVTDGVSLLFVYTGGYPSDAVVVGADLLVVGEKGTYKDTPQITGEPAVVVFTGTSTISDVAEPTVVTSITDLKAGMDDGSLISTLVKITGVVQIKGDYNNVYINDLANDTIDVVIYYKSPNASVEALEAQLGNTVTVVVYVYNNESVVFVGDAEDIE